MHQHSCTALFTHIVFSTHKRRPLILTTFRDLLYEYINGIVHNLGASPVQTGGIADHVHVLIESPPELCIAEIVRVMKANSSKWVRHSFSRRFAWQRGYGAFSVSKSNVEAVARYIANQEQHHRRMATVEELVLLFGRHGVSPAA